MPKYYCDYCDVYLTHDSSSVRKAHNNGKNHIMNVRNYYAELGQDKAQAIIDEITKAYECVGQAGFPPQYGYIPGIIPTVVAPAPPYATPVPPPLMMARPPVGGGAPGTVAAAPPVLNAPPPPPPVISGTMPPNPLPPMPPSSGIVPPGPSPPGALPPPGSSASVNAPGVPPQFQAGQLPRGVKRQMEE